jgi:succinate-acetate transporter protein
MNEIKLGNPGPWAVLAFSTTSFMLGVVNAGLLNGAGMPVVLDVALIFGGIMQIIVAVLEFWNGNTFTNAVFGVFGSFWLCFAAFELWFAPMIAKTNPAAIGPAVVLFLGVFAVLTFIFFLASLKTDTVLIIVFALVFIVLVLLACSTATGNASLGVLAGWLTIIFAILGWYHAAAGLIASTWGKDILPLGPIKK